MIWSEPGAELLGDHQGRVVGQHDAPGADADGGGGFGGVGERHGRGGAGDAGHVVVLGHPVAAVAGPLGVDGEVDGVAQRLSGR